MEGFFEGLGIAALMMLALIGLAVGWIAGAVSGRGKLLLALVGAIAAMATPFVLAALGITVLAAGGILLLVIAGAVGAALVVALVRLMTRGRPHDG